MDTSDILIEFYYNYIIMLIFFVVIIHREYNIILNIIFGFYYIANCL